MLTKNDRKVEAARKLIGLVKDGTFVPRRGNLLLTKDTYRLAVFGNHECIGCAGGGLLMVLADNDTEFNWHYGHGSVAEFLKERAFSLEEIARIEACFEDGGYVMSQGIVKLDSTRNEREFYSMYDNPEDRLIAICQNIIDNGGTVNTTCKVEFPEEVIIAERELVTA